MDKKQVGSSSSSSSSVSFDHLFGPKESSSSSSPTTGIFGSIFPPPSTVRTQDFASQPGNRRYGSPDDITSSSKGESRSSIYQSETVEPSYLSSSIYYGGQENYSTRTRATESNQVFKKDGGYDDSNGSNSNGTSRGNWWKGSLYY